MCVVIYIHFGTWHRCYLGIGNLLDLNLTRRKVEFSTNSAVSRKNIGHEIRTPSSNSNTQWFGEIGQVIVSENHNIMDSSCRKMIITSSKLVQLSQMKF